MGFGTSIIVALIGTVLYAIATRYEGAYGTSKIEMPVNDFISSATNYIWNRTATEEEANLLREYIEEIKEKRRKIQSQLDSNSDILLYVLCVFPFNTFILVDFAFSGSLGMAFIYTVLTYVFAAILIAIYLHIKTPAQEVQEENANFDKLNSELSVIPSDSDFPSLQKRYYKLNEMIFCVGKLSHLHNSSILAHNIAGVLSLVSFVATLLFSL